ncbi:LysR family transcriptional regulator [Streptomyces orinoci]|uniref:LysR family transcriptional regulator n=1 Tax=Streptomyces orinoci TaxID=67339 RepID=A0ABV3JR16_STRON|nr:LysR family transcriptional regulator [Streptomyces orinoci]
MELRQLEYFVAVVEEASFTRAAERLHIAQPGVSAQVRKLERELGQELLDRTGRTICPTEAGLAVLPYARAALAAVDAARHAVEELTGLVRGQVTLGTVTSLGPAIRLPELLDTFHRAHPAVEIGLQEDTSERLLQSLRNGGVDLAVVSLAGDPPEGIGCRVVARETLVLAVAHDDPLAGRTETGLEVLAQRPLMCLPRGTGLRTIVDRACAVAGVRPKVAFEAGDPNTLAQLTGRGLGIAVLPESLVRYYAAELTAVNTRPVLRGSLALAWRTAGPVSPGARAFLRHAQALLPPADQGRPGVRGAPLKAPGLPPAEAAAPVRSATPTPPG